MPLSSVVGAQSIIRPGVCTSSTRPASPYDGQVIYETDTDRTLVYNGTGWVFLSTSRANAGGLDFISSTTASAVSSISVNNCFTSAYENYFITFNKSASVGTDSSLTFRLRAASTDSTTNYKSQRLSSSSTTVAGITDPAGTDEWQIGYTNAANVSESYAINIFAPQTTTTTRYLTNSFFQENGGGANSYFLAGFNSASASYDGFTILTVGTSISGTIRVYGYVNS